MVITEIFKSIQGEGTRAGLPLYFVRLTGCNLRCTWCDTAYAFHGGTKQSIEQVLDRVDALAGNGANRVALVEITGGEPLLQPEAPTLAKKLLTAGYTVMIETSGERPVGVLPREVIKIVDVKCPDSGEPDTFDLANLDAVDEKDEIKFVISTRRDYNLPALFHSRESPRKTRPSGSFLARISRSCGKMGWAEAARDLAEWILADGLPVRLGLQLHKFIWDPAMKGV